MAVFNFTQGLVKGVANATNTPSIPTFNNTGTFGQSVNDTLARAGMNSQDASNILSAVQGTSTIESTDNTGNLINDELGTTVNNTEDAGVINVGTHRNDDTRLRLGALVGQETTIYGEYNPTDNVLSPLHGTGGLLFPYTPSISVNGESNWTSSDLTHTNYDILSYQRTPSATIGINGKFTVQNQREGEYALAAIHFLRTVTKMYFGDQDSANASSGPNSASKSLAGLPPPVLRLNGYGHYMFRDLRVVCKGYSFNFEENADLIKINLPTGGEVMLPPMFTLTINVGIQQSPSRVREVFKLNDFRTGYLMTSGRGWF